jgi:hypothetical protein
LDIVQKRPEKGLFGDLEMAFLNPKSSFEGDGKGKRMIWHIVSSVAL